MEEDNELKTTENAKSATDVMGNFFRMFVQSGTMVHSKVHLFLEYDKAYY